MARNPIKGRERMLIKYLLVLLAPTLLYTALLTACAATPTAAPTVRPPSPSPTPINCSQNPPGISLQAILGQKRIGRGASFENFRIEGKGFVPGEKLLIVIEGHGLSHGDRLESIDFPVGSDGSFVQREELQLLEPNMSWQVFVVHQRGVACTSFVTTP